VPLLPPISASGRPWGTKGRLLITLIQVCSLLATAWMVWWAALLPQLHQQTLGALLAQILGYTILAWVWSAVVAFGLYAIVPLEDRSNMVPDVLRTAATAVWFGPAMILLSGFSLASLLPALVLVVYASRLLYAQWRPQPVTAEPPPVYVPREPGSFADCQLPRGFVWRERLPALGVALTLEAGAAAVAMRYPLLGAAWLCLGTAILTVFSMTTGAANAGKPPTLPRSIVGILATVVLASLLTLGRGGGPSDSLFSFSTGGRGPFMSHPSLMESARAVLRQLFYGETPGDGGEKRALPRPQETTNTGASGGFPGVILWPELKPTVTLIAPLPALGTNPFQGRPAQPLSIPFGGEYWMFRWPFAHPPSTSIRERGTPATLAFSTTDHTPLQMEAHQKLETPIDVGCCGKIQLEVLNADRHPETLSLELILLNSDHPNGPPLSLGTAPVVSRPGMEGDKIVPVRETLEFAVPAKSWLDQFTEIKVVFHRSRPNADKSAKVAVERFVLLPR
jgi:hypothetical protein